MTKAAPCFAPAPEPPAGGFAEAPAGFSHKPTNADHAGIDPSAPVMGSEDVKRLFACDPGRGSVFVENADVFERRRHAYLVARAAVRDPDRIDDQEVSNLLDAELEAAEVILLATPAARPHQTWFKFSLLEEIIEDVLRHGEQSAPRLLLALASFKHDLCRYDFGDGKLIFTARS